MPEPVSEFLSLLDPTDFRIKNLPAFIFLCGGKIGKTHADFLSARHYLHWHITKNKVPLPGAIILAEDVNIWFHSTIYRDLLDLETDLAGLCSAIILFLESPGSIAELGSFVLLKPIAEKLIVFMQSDHSHNDSFITLGPIKHFENEHDKRVYKYPWKTRSKRKGTYLDKSSFSPIVDDVVKNILKVSKKIPKEQKFDKESRAHKILLIANLIHTFDACEQNELREYCKHLGVGVDNTDMKNYLTILKTLKIIDDEDYGHEKYYFSVTKLDYIKYSFQPATPADKRDTVRWQVQVREWHQKHDHRRVAAVKNGRARWVPK